MGCVSTSRADLSLLGCVLGGHFAPVLGLVLLLRFLALVRSLQVGEGGEASPGRTCGDLLRYDCAFKTPRP